MDFITPKVGIPDRFFLRGLQTKKCKPWDDPPTISNQCSSVIFQDGPFQTIQERVKGIEFYRIRSINDLQFQNCGLVLKVFLV